MERENETLIDEEEIEMFREESYGFEESDWDYFQEYMEAF